MTTAGHLFVRALETHGVDRVFCVPGESFLGALDALRDSRQIQVVTTRHESGAGFMAVADARLREGLGVAMVSRGPGASNATIAVHTAQQDAQPLLLVVGQVERADLQRGAFQEVDYRQMYGGMAKAVIEVEAPHRLGELMAQACHVALSGLPGPVILVVPEDVFEAEVPPEAAAPRFPVGRPGPAPREVAAVAERLAAAERPLVIAGVELATEAGRASLRRLADAWGVPVAVSSRQSDLLDNAHPGFAGHLSYAANREMVARLAESDLVLAIGTRLGDVTTQGYSFPAAPEPAQPVIQVHPEAGEIGRIRRVAQGVVSGGRDFCDALAAQAPAVDPWQAWRDHLHGQQAAWTEWQPLPASDGVPFGAVVAALHAQLPADAIVTSDAGNFGGWLNRHLPLTGTRRLLGPLSGAMGYGVPAAVAAALRAPTRKVVCFVGDGGLLMTGTELATAAAYGAAPLVVVSDNGAYGTIRLHQEKRFPGRPVATDLANPDFALFARAFGLEVVPVAEQDAVPAAVERALAVRGPALLHVRSSLDHISPGIRLSALAGA